MDAEQPKPPKDVVLVYSRTEDGEGAHVLRARDGHLETGEVRALREGAPLHGVELVTLRARQDSPVLFDVEVQYDGRGTESHAGPARVASRAYRENFDAIFGTRPDDEGGAMN